MTPNRWNAFACRCRFKRAPKWNWCVLYGNPDWPSACLWLVPGTFGHL
jgi:hypothetical protein